MFHTMSLIKTGIVDFLDVPIEPKYICLPMADLY